MIKIPNESVSKYSARALQLLKNITQNRIEGHEDDSDVKLCLDILSEALYDSDSHYGIKSENNDGYSVTFDDTDINKKAVGIAHAYIPRFMYAGIKVVGD